MREKHQERRLVEWARRKGGIALKLDTVAGIPDRLVLLPGGFMAFVELKTGSELSDLQRHWAQWLQQNGYVYHTSYDVGIIINALDATYLSATCKKLPDRK